MTGSTLFCTNCGQANSADATFCSRCGAPQKTVTPTTTVAPQPADPVAYAYPTQVGTFHGYGGFWLRFVAFIIDWIVLWIVTWPLRLFFFGFLGLHHRMVWMEPGMRPALPFIAAAGFFALVTRFFFGWLYWAGMESSNYQATLGKMALGLKVTDLSGNRISFGRASGRYFGKILSSMILLIGYIMAGFTERKQALHDMIAGTLVIKK